MNYGGVCRTAPATPGLLIISPPGHNYSLAPSEASAAVSLAPAPCLSSPYFLPSTSQEEDSGLESLVTTTSDSSSSSSRPPRRPASTSSTPSCDC